MEVIEVTQGWNKIPTLTENFAGVGTRAITDAGIQAIHDILEHNFKK